MKSVVNLETGLQVRALLFFAPTGHKGLRDQPYLKGLLHSVPVDKMPEALWTLVVIDRNGNADAHGITVRMRLPDGSTTNLAALEIDSDSEDVASHWTRSAVAAFFRGPGSYAGEVLIDGALSAVYRLEVAAPTAHA